ncbi:MAG TPA: metal ABC transporter ATP-binding protein [Magnetospirillaceae bacterium]|nr:metal ABC transporter ATP-binding protein [Magnetospirillaceae bacterium]
MQHVPQPIVSIHNASLRLGGRDLWQRLSLDVMPGEFIAILGPNGSGKSSLLKTLLGLHTTSGSVKVFGTSAANRTIGYIPQQKTFSADLPLTGRELVRLGINGTEWFKPFTTEADNQRVAAAIAEVGATAYADEQIGLLSGGEQQRLRIAQAIVHDPQLLLCDEPLLSLDMASQQATANLINKRRQQGVAVLFVTHEINPILPFVDRVLYLVGKKWAIGTPAEVLTSEQLTKLYGAPVEVLRVHGRIIVVSASEHIPTEPHDVHHHPTGAAA